MRYFKIIRHFPLEDEESFIAARSYAAVCDIVDKRERPDSQCYISIVEISQVEWILAVATPE